MLTGCIATSLPGHLLLLEATLPVVDGALPSMATNLDVDTYIAAHTRKSTTAHHHANTKGPLQQTLSFMLAVETPAGARRRPRFSTKQPVGHTQIPSYK
jgi:hypothetical protein